MSFDYDGTGVKPQQAGEYELIPEGWYLMKVDQIESVGQTKEKKDPLVTVNLKIEGGEYKGRTIKYHNVAFLPRKEAGAGIAIHWLKSIGQPWEGKFKISPKAWIGGMFYGQVKTKKKLNEDDKVYNEVKAILSCDDYEHQNQTDGESENPDWLGKE